MLVPVPCLTCHHLGVCQLDLRGLNSQFSAAFYDASFENYHRIARSRLVPILGKPMGWTQVSN